MVRLGVSKQPLALLGMIKTRWKGYTEESDTWEPIKNQAEDNPVLRLDYLGKIGSEQATAAVAAIQKKIKTFPKQLLK